MCLEILVRLAPLTMESMSQVPKQVDSGYEVWCPKLMAEK